MDGWVDGWTIETWTNAATPPTSPSRCYPSNRIPVVGTTGNTMCQCPRVLPSPQPDHWPHWWGSLIHHPQPELLQRWERHYAPWTRLSLCSSQGIGLIPGVLESPSRPPGCQDTSSWGRSQYKPSRPPVSFGRREQWLPGPARRLFPSAGVEYFIPRDSKSHRSMSSSRWLLTPAGLLFQVMAWRRIILLFVSSWNACKPWPVSYLWLDKF